MSRARFKNLNLIGLMLLAFGLRVYQLDDQSMWFDEAARLLISQADLLRILEDTGGDTLPPIYHLSLHFWQYLGSSDFWLRLPSVFASTATVAVIYSLALALLNQKTAIVAALIMAIMPYQIFHSQQANLYSYLVLLSGLQILFFWQAIKYGDRRWWIGYSLSLIVGMYVHYFAALVTLILLLWFVIMSLYGDKGFYRSRIRQLIVVDGISAILLLPLLNYLLSGTQTVASNFWLAKPSLVAPLSTIHLFTFSYSLPSRLVPVAFILIVSLLAVVSLELVYEYRRNAERRPALSLLFLSAFAPLLLVLLVAQIIPIYLDRTLIITVPAYYILIARGITETRWKSPVRYIAAFVGIIMLVSIYGYYFQSEFAKPDYRLAAEYLVSQVKSGQAVVHTSNGSYIPFLLYREPEDHFLLEGDPAPHHPPQVHKLAGGSTVQTSDLYNYDVIWLVVALDHSIDYQESTLETFDSRFRLLDEQNINGIIVRQYEIPSG